jgi:hypothetical protein
MNIETQSFKEELYKKMKEHFLRKKRKSEPLKIESRASRKK